MHCNFSSSCKGKRAWRQNWSSTAASFATFLLIALVAGCTTEQPAQPPVPPVVETAQSRFESIVETMRKRLEESDNSRFTFRDSAGAGSASYAFKVESSPTNFEPPERGENPRATIKVTMEYSAYTRPTESDNGEDGEKDEDRRGNSGDSLDLMEDSDAGGIEVLDSDLIDQSMADLPSSRIKIPDTSVGTRTGTNVTVYELVYRKDRWTLAEPPKADAPTSANNAMQRALERQG